MSVLEERNLQTTARWIELYNNDVHRMIDEVYADEFALRLPGFIELTDKTAFHEAEAYVLQQAPDRKGRILRAVAKDDTVTVECVLTGTDPESGHPWETYFCAILRFRDGRIYADHSYIDVAKWPGVADILNGTVPGKEENRSAR
ncbi:nuclear transport factor 2 family protein [Actinomadura rubrisoli]|nr:nuclear transport factor 2 family protein [Actinomadura rubrisoli]